MVVKVLQGDQPDVGKHVLRLPASRAASFGLRGGGRNIRLGTGRVHPHDLPEVTVEVLETAAVHEAVVLGGLGRGAAGVDRLVVHAVNTDAAVGGKGHDHLGAAFGIHDV